MVNAPPAPHLRRSVLSKHVLTLYDDPFLGGAVADFVDLALGEPSSSSPTWPTMAERLERRGFDVDGVEDHGEVDLADAAAAARWLGAAPPPATGRKRYGTSIRIRAWGDRTGVRWSAGAAPDRAELVRAPHGLGVLSRAGEAPSLCTHGEGVWEVGADGVAAVPAGAVGAALARATGCVRLRGILVVEGHPAGLPTAELALWWLRGP